MPKRKTQKNISTDTCYDSGAKPRRSIPVDEVNEIIEHEIRRVKASLTIYDDRLEVLRQLTENENELEYFQTRLHETQIKNKQLRSDLSRINLAISRQLDLDGE
jgi:hypothetical protein